MGKLHKILTPSERKKYLEEHVPYRLTALDGLCTLLHRGAIHTDPFVRNAMCDAGLIHMRTLFELLEIGANRKSNSPQIMEKAPKNDNDDITLHDLSNSRKAPLTSNVIVELFNSISSQVYNEDETKTIIAKILQYSSKASAHLVFQSKQPIDEKFYILAVVCIGSILDRIYDVEQMECPPFDAWTRRGDLLTPAEKEKHDNLVKLVRVKSRELRE